MAALNADGIMVYTNAGLELRAKMEAGASLDITRIVAGAARSADLTLLTAMEDIRAELSITGRERRGTQTYIYAVLHNKGLQTGFDLTQVGICANDPDLGEILYRVSEFKNAWPISAEADLPNLAIDCTFADNISNASTVNVTVDPSGSVTVSRLEAAIEALKAELAGLSGGGNITFSQQEPAEFKTGDLWFQLGSMTPVMDPSIQVVTLNTAPFNPNATYHAVINGEAETIESFGDGELIVTVK